MFVFSLTLLLLSLLVLAAVAVYERPVRLLILLGVAVAFGIAIGPLDLPPVAAFMCGLAVGIVTWIITAEAPA